MHEKKPASDFAGDSCLCSQPLAVVSGPRHPSREEWNREPAPRYLRKTTRVNQPVNEMVNTQSTQPANQQQAAASSRHGQLACAWGMLVDARAPVVGGDGG